MTAPSDDLPTGIRDLLKWLRSQSLRYYLRKRDALEEYIEAHRHLRAELAEAKRELETMRTAGIIEVAIRNRHYMNHWEHRAEQAEAALAEATRRGADELETRLWSIIDSDKIAKLPSDIAEAVSRLCSQIQQAEAARDRFAAVIAFLAAGGRYEKNAAMSKAGLEALARHRAAQGGK